MIFSFTSSAIRSISLDLFTWYGISVTMIACASAGNVLHAPHLARIRKRPRPVL